MLDFYDTVFDLSDTTLYFYTVAFYFLKTAQWSTIEDRIEQIIRQSDAAHCLRCHRNHGTMTVELFQTKLRTSNRFLRSKISDMYSLPTTVYTVHEICDRFLIRPENLVILFREFDAYEKLFS